MTLLKKVFLLSALAMSQDVIAMDAEQEHAAKKMARQEKLNNAKSKLNGLENLLQRKGWEGVENNGVWDWQPGQQAGNFDDISRQNAYRILSRIQQTGAISGEPDERERAGAMAQALGFGNLAKAFSRSTDNFFDDEGMPPEMREKIFEYAAGDGTVPRTPDQLNTLLNLSEVNHQTYDDVSQWRQYEKEVKEVVETVANIKANGWPEGDNLTLRAQINDRVLQKLVDEKFFAYETFINLSNTGITDVGLASLAQLSNLRNLNLSGCTGITDEGLASLAQLTSLRTLFLSGCTSITDAGLASLASLQHLKYLKLSGCTGITDEGLASLAQLKRLGTLYLSGCTGITGVGLAPLAQLPNLQLLKLSGCTGITDERLESLAQLSQLYLLDLSGCTGITRNALNKLRNKLGRTSIQT